MTGGWRPALAPSIVLRRDRVRDADLLVMPERVVVLSAEAAAIVVLCDGARSVEEIVEELSETYPGAPLAEDVPEFLDRIQRAGWVR